MAIDPRAVRSTIGPVAARRRQRRRDVQALAEPQGGILSRAQLYAAGVTRAEVRHNISAGRWQPLGTHCVCIHTGQLSAEARLWAAVLEAGPRAFLDGVTALRLAGLTNFDHDEIRVSVPRGARIRHRGTTVNIRQTRRWQVDDVLTTGIPRSRPPIAAVRGALWADSNRQAALILTMAVQQRICTVEQLAEQLVHIRRDRRRAFLNGIVLDLAGGVRSLGELDVVRGCRERGIPPPDTQVLRRTPGGIYYLDFRWARWGVVLEVDGIQHTWVENVVADALRQNSIVLDGDVVLRLPVLGLRVCPDQFFTQIAQALRAKGWGRVRRSA